MFKKIIKYQISILMLLLISFTSSSDSKQTASSTNDHFLELVTKAGNSSEEKVRYHYLNKAASIPNLNKSLKKQLDDIIPIVDYWANDSYEAETVRKNAAENGYLCDFFNRKIDLKKSIFPDMREDSPLYPIRCMYRGRMLIQRPIQSGTLKNNPEWRNAYYGEGRRLLKIASDIFPENKLIKMYLDEPLNGWPKEYSVNPRAPEWANLQREGLEKLTDVIHWWIDNRQIETGEFGGGWGDDCEMWRWWAAAMIAFDDPIITASQEKFSNGIFSQPHMKYGYTDKMSDVEHTAEDSKDAITAMMHLKPEDELWKKRALRIAQLMAEKWTGINQDGFMQFKGTYFNVHEVHPDKRRACETVWHPAAVQPTLLYWQRTKEKKLTKLFSEWMKVWIDVTERTERGKPAGIIPSAIHWPEGFIGGMGEKWYIPEIDKQAHLYDWPGAMTMLTNTLLLVYFMTGEEQYFSPIESMAEIRKKFLNNPPKNNLQPGSEMWCASKMDFLSETISKYRSFSKNSKFDELLNIDANGYTIFRLFDRIGILATELKKNATAFRSNWPAYTSEVRWTDRVISFTGNYLNYYSEPPLPQPNPKLLYSTVTGDMGDVGFFPMNAVRWLTLPRKIAALVTETTPQEFSAQLFHFGKDERKMGAELFLLESNAYQIILSEVSDSKEPKIITKFTQNINPEKRKILFTLPSQILCNLIIKQNNNRNEIQ